MNSFLFIFLRVGIECKVKTSREYRQQEFFLYLNNCEKLESLNLNNERLPLIIYLIVQMNLYIKFREKVSQSII